MPKKSKSSAKKKRKEKKLEPITETIEENKAFKFEFDEFIIENAPEHIKMFAKPDASLHGEKQFQVKITKDETGKAQFDIKFIKSPEEDNGLGRVSSVPSDSDKGQVTAIVISPDENKLDLINAPSFPQQVEPSTAMSGNLNDRNIHRSQNIFQLPNQPPHDRNKSAGNNTYKNNHHNRYYNIRSQLLNEENEAAYPRIHPDNSRTNNTQEQLLTNVNMEYVPNDFFTSTDSFISSTPLETKSKRFPILQLKGDETEPYIVEDAQGKQFLVKPILYTKHHDAGEPSTSKYVPKGEPKKSGKKNDQTPNGMPYLQHIGVGSESHMTKNTGCGSKDLSKDSGEVLKTDAGTSTDPMEQLKETEARQTFDQAMKAETERYIDQAKERTVDTNNNASPNDNVSTETLVDETPLNTLMQPDETKWNSNAQSTSSITSHKTFPSEWNFVITSACQNYPEKKQQQMKDIVSEILDYFDTDLIKGLMAQKIEEEREFIIKYMNHKGKYGKFQTKYSSP